jgi:hypothetical protein
MKADRLARAGLFRTLADHYTIWTYIHDLDGSESDAWTHLEYTLLLF